MNQITNPEQTANSKISRLLNNYPYLPIISKLHAYEGELQIPYDRSMKDVY